MSRSITPKVPSWLRFMLSVQAYKDTSVGGVSVEYVPGHNAATINGALSAPMLRELADLIDAHQEENDDD